MRFIDQIDDCAYVSTSAEKLIPLDESAAKIRKHIQERQPTPYSKSHAKRASSSSRDSLSNENDLEMGFLVDPTKTITFGFEKSNGSKGEEFFEGSGLRKTSSLKSKADRKQEDNHLVDSPEFTVDFDTVINPNIGGNGNYAIVKLTQTSAKKIGTDKAITPLKRLKREDQDSACRGNLNNHLTASIPLFNLLDFQSVPMCLEDDIAFIPYDEEIVKNLKNKYTAQ